MINALNSGASVFMADFEDALSPTWENVVDGQAQPACDAVRRTLAFDEPGGQGVPARTTEIATLVVRPRGWHLDEKHVAGRRRAGLGQPLRLRALLLPQRARSSLARGSGPVLLPAEAREPPRGARCGTTSSSPPRSALGIPRGTIRATVLIETILAAFEMEEILYELRDHAAGLNAGRWDYIFSIIKKFRDRRGLVLPDRAQVTMTVPFMRAYTELLVQTCHRRGAHAIGGMAAFIPSRRDAEVNERALAKVREDKERESRRRLRRHLGGASRPRAGRARGLRRRPRRRGRTRRTGCATTSTSPAAELLDFRVAGRHGHRGRRAREHRRRRSSTSTSWLRGNGAAAINNLMEDAATAEISRSQLWQWRVTRRASSTTAGR